MMIAGAVAAWMMLEEEGIYLMNQFGFGVLKPVVAAARKAAVDSFVKPLAKFWKFRPAKLLPIWTCFAKNRTVCKA